MCQYDETSGHSKLVYRSAVEMDEVTFTKHCPTVQLVAVKNEVLPSPEAVTLSVLHGDDIEEASQKRDPLAADPLIVQKKLDFTTKIKTDPEKEIEVFIKSEAPDIGILRSPCIDEHDFESSSDTGKANCNIEVGSISTISTSDNRVPRCNITLHQSIPGITDQEENEISTKELDETMDTFNLRRKYGASKHTQDFQKNYTCSRSRVMRKWSERNYSQAKTEAKKASSVHDFERMPMVVIPRDKEIERLAAHLRAASSSSEQFRASNEVTSVPVAKLRETAMYKRKVINHSKYRNDTKKIPPVKLRKVNGTGTWKNASEVEEMLDSEIESLLGAKETRLLMQRAGILPDVEVKGTQQTKKKERSEKQNTNIYLNEDKINDNILEVQKKTSEVDEINDNILEVQKKTSEVDDHTEELHLAETNKMLEGQSCGHPDIPVIQKRYEATKGLSSHVCSNCHKIFKRLSSLHGHRAHCPVPLKVRTTLKSRTISTLLRNDLRSNNIESTCTQKNLKAMKYSCKFCGKILSCKSNFLRHTAMHARKYWCHVCGKGFPVITRLKTHLRVHTQDKPYQCGVCGNTYTTKRAMQRHERKTDHHSTERKLKTTPKNKPSDVNNCTFHCDICEKTFLTLKNLTEHKNIHIKCPPSVKAQRESVETEKTHKTNFSSNSNISEKKENQLCCQICDKEFSSNYCLRDHHYYHIGDTTYRCDSCQVAYRTADGLRHHHNKVHNEKLSLSCKNCRQSFPSHINLHEHECTNAKAEFPCEHCQKVFPTDETLNLHKVMHVQQLQHLSNGNKIHHKVCKTRQCPICGKFLSSLYSLKRHILVHSGKKPRKCKICGKEFTNSFKCKMHEYTHTRVRSMKCDICENTFYGKQALERHKQLHRKEHQFTNDLCMKVFTSKHHKNDGEISNIIPSTCNICNKSFSTTDSSKSHHLIHLKNLFGIVSKNIPPRRKAGKKFSCSICGLILQTKSGYYNHTFLHTGKPFECKICNKKFSFFSRFQDHINAHTAERPYQCNECPKKYASRDSLRKHKHIHSKKNKLGSNTTLDKGPYKCSKCDRIFVKHSMLLRHKCFLHLNVKFVQSPSQRT